MKTMLKTVLSLLAAIAVLTGVGERAQAGFVFGAQAFSSSATTSTPGVNPINNSTFTLNFNTLLGGTNQTDKYVGTIGTFVDTINTSSPLSFVFGSALYGTFTPNAVLVNVLIPNTSRTVQLAGTFAPNAITFGPGSLPTPGILTITVNQARIGHKAVLSGSATLATAAPVPEPSTFVMLAGACGPLAFCFVRRRAPRQRSFQN